MKEISEMTQVYIAFSEQPIPETRIDAEAMSTEILSAHRTQEGAWQACQDDYTKQELVWLDDELSVDEEEEVFSNLESWTPLHDLSYYVVVEKVEP